MQSTLYYSSEAVSAEFLHINNCSVLKHDVQDSRSLRPRGRLDYLLIFIRTGCCYLNLDTPQAETIPAGRVLLFHPGEPQDYSFLAADASTEIYIHFTGNGCASLLEQAGLTHKSVLIPSHPGELEHYLLRICESFDSTNNQANLLCEGLLMAALGLLSESNTPSALGAPRFSRELGEIIGNIRTYANQPYNLDLWAKQCSISKTHFIQIFKDATGLPPYQYLTTVRIRHAKEQLLFTNLSGAKIGELNGYPDYNYFSRVFKKYVGMTPTEYRRQQNQKSPTDQSSC